MNKPESSPKNEYPFLKGGGEMGQLIRSFNWSETALGTPACWPQSLKTTLSIVLNSKFPMFLYWGPQLICFYNDAYRPSLGQNGKHPAILGIPAIKAWEEAWDVVKPLTDHIMAGGEAALSEDQLIPIYRNGKMEDVYWTYSYSPVTDESGNVAGIFVACSETTEKIVASRHLEENNRQLRLAIEADHIAQKRIMENERNLRLIIMQAPVAIAIFRDADYVVEIVNSLALQLWGRGLDSVLNKPILEAMPELKTQGIKELLDHVYQTGEPFVANELPVQITRGGELQTAYINFVYEPLYDLDGNINGLITIGTDVTDQFINRKRIVESSDELQSINEELVASNEELASTNEELASTNEELAGMQDRLQNILNALTVSEGNFRNMILQAPVAMGLFTGEDMVLEIINDTFLALWDKEKTIIGKPLTTALPELIGQPYLQIMQDVFHTGNTYYGSEASVFLHRNGQTTEGFYNFINQAFIDTNGDITGIIVVAIEVTDQVNARKNLEQAYEQARLSKEAAQLGTFDMDLEKGTMEWDNRCRTLFGISHNNDVTYEKDFITGLYLDDRERVLEIIDNAFIKSISNGDYDVEYRTVGADDQKLRWVRAKGKVYFNKYDKPVRFIGSVLEITEQKLDELRKNDFIGMVSHELKTPLTSLSAYVQMLHAKAQKGDDPFSTAALEKANIQTRKMANLINGFLNISRLESGKILIVKQKFELVELILEMIDEIKLTTPACNINLHERERIEIYADRDKIGSVITNLLSNAIKYSPVEKNIDIQCRQVAGYVQVSIKDQGMGINPQDVDKLFNRYYRVESKHTAHISGFGIGLYLSAEIIYRHDGKIGVESELDKGSTFWFTLPLITA